MSLQRSLISSRIDASYQVSDQLTKRFQRRRLLEIDQSEIRIACGGHDKHGRHRQFFFSDWLISEKYSPLKPLCQMNQKLVGSIYGRFSIKIAHFVPIY
jgi:hypothetical protein